MRKALSRIALAAVFLAVFTGSLTAQSLTINGETQHHGVVGDTLILKYEFVGSDSVAFGEVWIDFDENGAISPGDYPLFKTRRPRDFFVDGAPNDIDGAKDGTVVLEIDSFFPLAPASFVFRLTQENGEFAEAIYHQGQMDAPYVVEGKVENPDSTENLYVWARTWLPDTTHWEDDTTGGGHGDGHGDGPPGDGDGHGDGPPNDGGRALGKAGVKFARPFANATLNIRDDHDPDDYYSYCYNYYPDPDQRPGPDVAGLELVLTTRTDANGGFSLALPSEPGQFWEIGVVDEFGVAKGVFPPEPMEISTDSLAIEVAFKFDSTSSVIDGKVVDILGNKLMDVLGNPQEVEVLAFLMDSRRFQRARTVDGEFSLDVIPGQYYVFVEGLEGRFMHPEPQYADIAEADTQYVAFSLLPLDGYISGRVFVVDGEPLPCVRVFAGSSQGHYVEGVTDREGFFKLRVSTAIDLWNVELDMYAIPRELAIVGDPVKVVQANTDEVNFELVKRNPGPRLRGVRDIPGDQGLQVRLAWRGSEFDTHEGPGHDAFFDIITSYSVWRRGPMIERGGDDGGDRGDEGDGDGNGDGNGDGGTDGTGGGAALGKAAELGVKAVFATRKDMMAAAADAKPGDRYYIAEEFYVWDYIASIPAVQFPVYSFVAPTLHDSTGRRPGWSHFVVAAHTQNPYAHYFSNIDSGYSVDNLRPRVDNIAVQKIATGVQISWQNPETPDMTSTRIYRSSEANFKVEGAEMLAETAGKVFVDRDADGSHYYRLKAYDDGGNVTVTEAFSLSTTGVGDPKLAGIPEVFELEQNYPNPFNPSTQIVFGLPEDADVRLVIFDAVGKQVRTLASARYAAGYHKMTWDGRNQAGTVVPSGLYFYKLQSGNTVLHKKMLLTR